MNTDKDFAPYEPSLALKELGFDEPCFTFYPKEGKMGFDGKYHSIKEGYKNSTVNAIWIKRYKKDFECVAAPLYQQAFSFLRNRYNLSFHISDYYSKENWKLYGRAYQIFINGKQEIIEKSSSSSVKLYFTYEEAELACLVKLIEICKNK